MHAHGTQPQQAADQRESRQVKKPSTLAERVLKLQGLAGNLAVSRALAEEEHAHGPGCGHAETPATETPVTEAAVQRRATLEDALAEPGRPLESRIRDKAERVYPMKFGHVRWHDGPVAQRAAREFGAQALTVGPHILAAEPNLSDEIKLHEVDHTYQNAMGDVAGTADGAGTKVSSPGDPYEVKAASNGKKVAQGGAPDLSLPGRPAPVEQDDT
ncbi:eCIS core domain-containing protein [Streptomyces inhibens]|uniref:eCIS core domain-containing protein n=1 Tax=Streptomyces inhibens TaxID=2293571 RepID=UPI00402ABA21